MRRTGKLDKREDFRIPRRDWNLFALHTEGKAENKILEYLGGIETGFMIISR